MKENTCKTPGIRCLYFLLWCSCPKKLPPTNKKEDRYVCLVNRGQDEKPKKKSPKIYLCFAMESNHEPRHSDREVLVTRSTIEPAKLQLFFVYVTKVLTFFTLILFWYSNNGYVLHYYRRFRKSVLDPESETLPVKSPPQADFWKSHPSISSTTMMWNTIDALTIQNTYVIYNLRMIITKTTRNSYNYERICHFIISEHFWKVNQNDNFLRIASFNRTIEKSWILTKFWLCLALILNLAQN